MSLGQLRIHLVRDSRDIEQQQAEIQRVQIASPTSLLSGSWTGFCNQYYYFLRELALEMTFNISTAKRVSCFGQYDRIDDLIPCNLRGDKCPVFRQFFGR